MAQLELDLHGVGREVWKARGQSGSTWVQERDQKHHSLNSEVTGTVYMGALFPHPPHVTTTLHCEQYVFMTLADSKQESIAQYCLQGRQS